MTCLLRKALLVSSTALFGLAILPAVSAVLPLPHASVMLSVAEARGGSDDGDDDSGRSGSDDHDSSSDDSSDDSGRGSDDDDDDGDDDHGRHHGSDDDSDDDDDDDSNDDHGRRRGGDRDEIRLIVNDAQLNGLRSGSMIAVDQNGNPLRFEVEEEHGNTEIKLRAPKGTLTKVTVIPAS